MALPPFASSRELTLGVELELQIVDPHRHDLIPLASDLLALMRHQRIPGDVKPEMTCSMIEIATGICTDHAQVLDELEQTRFALLDCAQRLGVGLCGGGTHVFQDWSERTIYDTPRFQQLSALYGYLAKQFTVFGQHVHVGCPNADQALPLLHGLSRFVPHLIALSASSPYVRGVDTLFQSARLNSVFAFPLSGRAPFVLTWEDFKRYFHKMARTGVIQGMKDFYWDIRPKPEFGTIEVRVMDTPLTVQKAADLAAYIQCLARSLLAEPLRLHEDDYLPYTFNRFQACRFGLEAVYVDPATNEHHQLKDAILSSMDRLEDHAIALRAEGALQRLRADVLSGQSDARWLRDHLAPVTEPHRHTTLVGRQVERWRGLDT